MGSLDRGAYFPRWSGEPADVHLGQLRMHVFLACKPDVVFDATDEEYPRVPVPGTLNETGTDTAVRTARTRVVAKLQHSGVKRIAGFTWSFIPHYHPPLFRK